MGGVFTVAGRYTMVEGHSFFFFFSLRYYTIHGVFFLFFSFLLFPLLIVMALYDIIATLHVHHDTTILGSDACVGIAH